MISLLSHPLFHSLTNIRHAGPTDLLGNSAGLSNPITGREYRSLGDYLGRSGMYRQRLFEDVPNPNRDVADPATGTCAVQRRRGLSHVSPRSFINASAIRDTRAEVLPITTPALNS